MKSIVRYVNDYRVIYLPDHLNAITHGNWMGWIYEHIVVAEKMIGRQLRHNEVVHHLDFNRSNNRTTNLIVLERSQHARLHAWLDAGAPGWQQPGENRVNSGKSKLTKSILCKVCSIQLQGYQDKYCSHSCAQQASRKVPRPSVEELEQDICSMTWESIARKYGVTSGSIRKWARKYQLI